MAVGWKRGYCGMTGSMTKMAKRLIFWFTSLACVLGIPAWSQASNAFPISGGPVLTPYGTPAVNAPVRVCLITAIGTPCSTAGVTLYSDDNLTQKLPNPTSTNSQGVYSFFTTNSQTIYLLQIQATPTTTYTYYIFGGTPSGAGGCSTVSQGGDCVQTDPAAGVTQSIVQQPNTDFDVRDSAANDSMTFYLPTTANTGGYFDATFVDGTTFKTNPSAAIIVGAGPSAGFNGSMGASIQTWPPGANAPTYATNWGDGIFVGSEFINEDYLQNQAIKLYSYNGGFINIDAASSATTPANGINLFGNVAFNVPSSGAIYNATHTMTWAEYGGGVLHQVDATTAPFTLTLPPAAGPGGNSTPVMIFWKSDATANAVTIAPAAGDMIAGAGVNPTLASLGATLELIADGTHTWYEVGNGVCGPLSGDATSTNCGNDNLSGNTATDVQTFGYTNANIMAAANKIGVGAGNFNATNGLTIPTPMVAVGYNNLTLNGATINSGSNWLYAFGSQNFSGGGTLPSSVNFAEVMALGDTNICASQFGTTRITDSFLVGETNDCFSGSGSMTQSNVFALGDTNVNFAMGTATDVYNDIIGIGDTSTQLGTQNVNDTSSDVIGIGNKSVDGNNISNVVGIGKFAAEFVETSNNIFSMGNTTMRHITGSHDVIALGNTILNNSNLSSPVSTGLANVIALGKGILPLQIPTSLTDAICAGDGACPLITGGSDIIAIGRGAGASDATGTQGVWIGQGAGPSAAALTNTVAIGQGATVNMSNQTTIGNSSVTSLKLFGCPAGQTVYDDGTGTCYTPGSGGGGVSSFSAPSASWPTWLVPTVTNPTTTPSLGVAASTIPVSAGGTGTTTPGLVAGTNITVTGTWPNQTINSTGGGAVSSLTTTGTTGAATLSGGVLNIPQYQGALTLTTTGTSGAATLTGNTLNIPQYAGGGMVYPGAGVPNSTGTAWGTSYTVGTAASNLVQLNASAQLPAVSGVNLTALPTSTALYPTLNQNTTGTAANVTGIVAVANGGTGTATFGAYSLLFNNSASTAAPTIVALSALPAAQFPTLNQNTTGTAAGLTSYPTLCTGGQFSQGLSSGSNNCATPSGTALPSGVNGQTLVNNGTGPANYSAQSPTIGIANGGAAITTSYTLACDSATVATGIQDRGKVAVIGAGGSVTVPDLAGTGCSGFFGMVQNSDSASHTVSRQTSDTFNIYGPTQAAPLTAQTSFSLAAGQWATFQPSTSATAYDVRIYSPSVPAGVSNITVTVGTTAVSANSCGTVQTATMTGLTTTMAVNFTPNSDVSAVTGWSPASTGQLYFTAWPSAANTLSYYVCNPTSSSITPGASTTWNVSAK